ncbi:Cid1 family poly A polymerase [Nitzschia inconspicua]|uniref:Cid1 family poly A polymerase n=1 Tax=Nitzschia inconspicua TaxID=303405 RepID=A0A9K3Q308_9STRA|nr:Cid1 family poly A polymerase [Nitzschia inconspicua]
MSSTPPSGRKPGRGGGGRGRGRGGGRKGGNRGGRSNNASRRSVEGPRSNNAPASKNGTPNGADVASNTGSFYLPELKDEEILIAFMPYMKGDNLDAINIHETYQSDNDQKAFLLAARKFLHDKKSRANEIRKQSDGRASIPAPSGPMTPSSSIPSNTASTTGMTDVNDSNDFGSSTINELSQLAPAVPSNVLSQSQHLYQLPNSELQQDEESPGMEILERKMAGLLADDDDVITMPIPFPTAHGSTIGPSSPPAHHSTFDSLFPSNNSVSQSNQMSTSVPHQHPFHESPQPSHGVQHQPPSTFQQSIQSQRSEFSSSPFTSLFASTNNGLGKSGGSIFQTHLNGQPPPSVGTRWSNTSSTQSATSHSPPPRIPMQSQFGQNQPPSTSLSPMHTPTRTPVQAPETPSHLSLATEMTPAKPAKKEYQPKRLWTHLEDQPGKIFANNVAASIGTVVDLRPRQELTARWMLPLSYLREKAEEQNVRSIRDLLKNLSVGLFRRGCTENGSQASIVSKEIVSPSGESRDDYPFQITQDSVVGTVPFYSPRTPGHVVFRMYWHDNPLHTLATGPTLNVRITENDFEPTIRFILSNFKAKKVNPTSLSSLNSLSLLLEQFHISSNKVTPAAQHQLESAGRAVWGCVCEARKVLDACSSDYQKTTGRLEKLEESIEELKEAVAAEDGKDEVDKIDVDDEATQRSAKSGDAELSVNAALLREKTKMLMSGRASCERKWRDSQLAFASILKAIVSNPSMAYLLRRELITKLRLEYELWCPLCEEFAVPGDNNNMMWYEPINRMPQPITTEHFRVCNEARSKMQLRILGFDPNFQRLESILYPARDRNRQMNPVAVNVFNQLSSSMGQLYQEVYFTGDKILQQREMIRAKTEQLVNMCECFPPGTRVAIFGSSANGYGSPTSDLDMCLQIPNGTSIVNEDDPTGAIAMATLAKLFEDHGMQEVDTARLTARIPVVKFNCSRGNEGDLLQDEDLMMECDLSMHNPLAVLNTSLLRTYAEINPVSRVLAAIVKRWAKARDINNPARHTLSSYGYILMLLHFLTYHRRSGNGLVSPVEKSTGNNQNIPLLPNLQWMDERWPQSPAGTPYTEYKEQPKAPMQHPIEENTKVNSYFYRPNASMLSNLQRLFPGQDLSLAILLASFFRYYAYEFDYKRHVVSLHSTIAYGVVEREVKAELDGWRNYSAALTIEDPFETFYDVAHVLRGGYYHRIRREFAVAYSKIADVASSKTSGSWNNRTVDLTNMTGMALIDWICEPVANGEREDAFATEIKTNNA